MQILRNEGLDDAEPVALDAAAFMITIDFELLWGSFSTGKHHEYEAYFERRGLSPMTESRRIVAGMLDAFDRHAVPATWATVGHLFLDSCARDKDTAHADMPRAHHAWFAADWYRMDPCRDTEHAPLWYAPDLIRRIRAARVGHEIGCHSFSHVIFGDPGCPADVANAEIAKCVSLAAAQALELRSFVFPRNSAGHLPALLRNGITNTRGELAGWFNRMPTRILRRAAHFADDVLAITPPSGVARRHESGLFVSPLSMFLQSYDGLRAAIPTRSRIRKAIRGIEHAIRRRQVFHLTTHCVNFFAQSDEMLSVLDEILSYAAARRDAGELRVFTMTQLEEASRLEPSGYAGP